MKQQKTLDDVKFTESDSHGQFLSTIARQQNIQSHNISA